MSTMHAAHLDHSPRLQRVRELLRQRGPIGATSLEIATNAMTVAPATCVSELRKSGHQIDCKREKHEGRRVWRYVLRGSQGHLDLFGRGEIA